jgi:hypothetical protein
MTGGQILGPLSQSATTGEQRENVLRLKRCFFVGLVMWPLYTPLDFLAAEQGSPLRALLAVRVSVPVLLLILLVALRTKPPPAGVIAIEVFAFATAATGLGLHAFLGPGFRAATFTSTFVVLVIQGLILPSHWKSGIWRTAPTALIPQCFLALSYWWRPELRSGGDPFDPGDLREAREVASSKAIHGERGPAIIVSASGMATGGRVLHHLAARLPDPRNSVILAGFQASETRGRLLLERRPFLKMLGRYVPVRAEVVDASGFSVHADQGELLAWPARASSPPGMVFVVHGEPGPAQALRTAIGSRLGFGAVVPRQGEKVFVDRSD